MTKKKKINSIVVGSGFGGIASALRLRALGHNVTLIDRLPEIGGRAQVFNLKGFKHDAGPQLLQLLLCLTSYLVYLVRTEKNILNLSL